MDFILSELKKDHKYMLKLLYQLDQQVKALGGLNNTPLDMDLLLEIVDYIKRFPDFVHHKVEEEMFSYLADKDLEKTEQALVNKVVDEHPMLDALSELLELRISEYLADNSKKVPLIRVADMFVQQQIKHIECEQVHVFVLCQKYLRKKDWKHLQKTAEKAAADQNELTDYLNIREKIAQSHALTA
jgi:hemerythrin-like domain-containing protein